jgi:site-specific DNA-cytosine methylase
MDRLRALGNAIVPQCSEWIGRKLWESGILQSSN